MKNFKIIFTLVLSIFVLHHASIHVFNLDGLLRISNVELEVRALIEGEVDELQIAFSLVLLALHSQLELKKENLKLSYISTYQQIVNLNFWSRVTLSRAPPITIT